MAVFDSTELVLTWALFVTVPEVGRLDVWALRSYGGGVFVPLRDRTSGHATYGGGRYLIDTAKGADLGSGIDDETGAPTLVLDFNFAYHPSCTYDPAFLRVYARHLIRSSAISCRT